MSLLAGIFSRVPGRGPDPAARAALVRALSRHPGDRPLTHGDDRCFLAMVDVGAWGPPAVHRAPDGAVTLLAGEPLLEGGGGRAGDLARLHAALRAGDTAALRRARGVFAAAHYDPAAGRLALATDALGVRPLHVWTGEETVVFASALRVLEAVDLVPRAVDPRGVAEIAAIGIPLVRRTPYAGVERAGAAELREVDARGARRTVYHRWDEPALEPPTGDALVREVDRRFREATALRLGGDRATLAFLSGGMDSRALVAVLRDEGAAVHTFNHSLPGMQDHVFAGEFARAAGTLHGHRPLELDLPGAKFSMTLGRAWAASPLRHRAPPERPSLAWSGDGGSVGLGHVYLSRPTVALLREGRTGAAVDRFMDELGMTIPRRLVRPEVAEWLCTLPRQGVLEELEGLRGADPVRRFHLFLLLNDQRRHLTGHFEHLDLHRVEFQLPFFDTRLLECIAAAPAEPFLYHALYARWFDLLPACVRAVPWQTYPGHVSCPLPAPALPYQWDRRSFVALRAQRRTRLLRETGEVLRSPYFPAAWLRRMPLRAAAMAHGTRLRDYDYVLRVAVEVHRHFAACRGRVASQAPAVPLS